MENTEPDVYELISLWEQAPVGDRIWMTLAAFALRTRREWRHMPRAKRYALAAVIVASVMLIGLTVSHSPAAAWLLGILFGLVLGLLIYRYW